VSDLTSAALPALGPHDHVRGREDAPLVILYADFSCPHCVLANQRLSGLRLRLAFRHFALRARHPRALALAHAAEAAGCQGRFWEMYEALFDDPGRLDDPHLWARARRLGLDLDRFERDRRGPAVAERVRRDVQGALRAGVTTTPTLFAAGRLHPGAPGAQLLDALDPPFPRREGRQVVR
jgi:protein-disulfide isomerase